MGLGRWEFSGFVAPIILGSNTLTDVYTCQNDFKIPYSVLSLLQIHSEICFTSSELQRPHHN